MVHGDPGSAAKLRTGSSAAVFPSAHRGVPFAQHGKVLAERIPGAELVALRGGEHVAIFTHREEARARVVRFLAASAG